MQEPGPKGQGSLSKRKTEAIVLDRFQEAQGGGRKAILRYADPASRGADEKTDKTSLLYEKSSY